MYHDITVRLLFDFFVCLKLLVIKMHLKYITALKLYKQEWNALFCINISHLSQVLFKLVRVQGSVVSVLRCIA